MNNNKTRGISGLSILLCVLVLAGVYWFMSQSGVQQTAYTYQDFQKDLKKEKVESVEVKQNKVAPTGTLKIRLKNDDIEQLHVSDVNSAEDLLDVCAGCRTAGRKGRACRDRGFPQEPREVYAGRSQNPERCPS